jgi:hypothetical protein
MGPLTTRCAIGAQQCRRPSTQITATTNGARAGTLRSPVSIALSDFLDYREIKRGRRSERSGRAFEECLLLCRFLDAGNNEGLGTLS